ncbi:MAG: hypothetical protein K4H23_05275 [Mollicutes bacterium PWAP]|nr:hypothetical protein [Mollicutes bacterium PWAP]
MKAGFYPVKDMSKKETTLIIDNFNAISISKRKLIDASKKYKNPIAVLTLKEDVYLGHGIHHFDSKVNILASLGVDMVQFYSYKEEENFFEGLDFIKKAIKTFKASRIIVSENFSLKSKDNFDVAKFLKNYPTLEVIKEEKLSFKKVDEDFIKENISTGDFKLVKALMGQPWSLKLKLDNELFFEYNKKLPNFNAGIYAVNVIFNNLSYWGVLYKGFENKSLIVIPHLKKQNANIEVEVFIWDSVRTIISKRNDEITDIDIDKAREIMSKIIL